MNKNEELLPYYEKLAKMIEFREGLPYWTISPTSWIKAGNEAGSINSYGYHKIRTTINGIVKCVTTHRLHWYIAHNEMPNIIDHINRNKSDNRIENLRSVNSSINNQNVAKKENMTSRFMGVSLHKKNKKWITHLTVNRIRLYLGTYKTEDDAAMAYDNACRYHDIEFSNLNFPIK